MIFEKWKTSIGMTPDSIDIVTIVRATSKFRIKRVVIGPAIEPSGTRSSLVNLIKGWIAAVHLSFLERLTVLGVYLAKALDTLEPQTAIEESVVECLEVALAQTVQE